MTRLAFRIISIHVPVWGRLLTGEAKADADRFQSTPPYGGDPIAESPEAGSGDFNPRPRMGATSSSDTLTRVLSFQSTPPYGGDTLLHKLFTVGSRFQSTPPYGGDCQTRQHDILSHTRLISRKSSSIFLKPHPWVLFFFLFAFPSRLQNQQDKLSLNPTNIQTRNSLLFYHF